MLGSRCLRRMRAGDAPSERAASTYSISLACRICARASRAYPAQPVIISAKMTLSMPGPRKAANAIGREYPGKKKKRMKENNIHEPIEPSAEIAGDGSDRKSDDARTEHDAYAHE